MYSSAQNPLSLPAAHRIQCMHHRLQECTAPHEGAYYGDSDNGYHYCENAHVSCRPQNHGILGLECLYWDQYRHLLAAVGSNWGYKQHTLQPNKMIDSPGISSPSFHQGP